MTWWRKLLQRDRAERQLDAELRDHFERLVAGYVGEGLTAAAARRKARLAFGGLEQVKEDCRDVRGTRWLEEIAQDLRYGLRLLRQSPAFTLVAVASLAPGIGANSTIFALVDGVLLKSLPVREPERLVLIPAGSWTNPSWEQLRDRQQQWSDGAVAWSGVRFDLSKGGATESVEGLWTNGGFFEVLGVPAVLGRTFSAADDRRSRGPDGPVAVISYAFWQRHFGGEAGVIGRSLTLDRVPFTIVGVTPPSFLGPCLLEELPMREHRVPRRCAAAGDRREREFLRLATVRKAQDFVPQFLHFAGSPVRRFLHYNHAPPRAGEEQP